MSIGGKDNTFLKQNKMSKNMRRKAEAVTEHNKADTEPRVHKKVITPWPSVRFSVPACKTG